jgi:hypothetical protein
MAVVETAWQGGRGGDAGDAYAHGGARGLSRRGTIHGVGTPIPRVLLPVSGMRLIAKLFHGCRVSNTSATQ